MVEQHKVGRKSIEHIENASCTGCGFCTLVCPNSAIEMQADKKGFYYPKIKQRCIGCGNCYDECPNNTELHTSEYVQVCYAAWIDNIELRKRSASGGIFRAIADYVVENDGVVYGVGFAKDFELEYLRVDNIDDLTLIIGSKYVQSQINVYDKIEEDINKDRVILVSGTPCQIAALKKRFNDYDNIYFVDLFCHGVASPNYFKKYIDYVQSRFKSKLNKVNFRCKFPGWTVYSMALAFDKNSNVLINKYDDLFLGMYDYSDNYLLRDSCFECKYTSLDRVGDISLGDFWGYKAEDCKRKGIERGVNCVLVNTDKGDALFKNVADRTVFYVADVKDCFNHCLKKPSVRPIDYEKFWIDFFEMSLTELVCKYYTAPSWKFRCHEQLKVLKRANLFIIKKLLLR